jgi:hypothetical protein
VSNRFLVRYQGSGTGASEGAGRGASSSEGHSGEGVWTARCFRHGV